jgi:uncharacterized membrane protein
MTKNLSQEYDALDEVGKGLDQPLRKKTWVNRDYTKESSFASNASEAIAGFLGTPAFIFWLTIFCIVWLAWNTLAPESWRFDSADRGFTALTLMLSLQASYAAPLILFAQNKQAQRDKVSIEQDREDAARNLNDTEFILREIADIRLSIRDIATSDFVANELRDILKEIQTDQKLLKPQKNRSQAASNKSTIDKKFAIKSPTTGSTSSRSTAAKTTTAKSSAADTVVAISSVIQDTTAKPTAGKDAAVVSKSTKLSRNKKILSFPADPKKSGL